MECLRETLLDNDISVKFFTLSNRYFGDFNRVVVRVEVCSMREGNESLRYVHSLEQMGVPSCMVSTVEEKLIADFLDTTSAYLSRPGFLEQVQLKKKNGAGTLAPSC